MPTSCNRRLCPFCAGDTSQLYCDGCHAPLGSFEPGKVALCETCLTVRQRTRANGGRCSCPVGQRRETLARGFKGEYLGCARCMGVIRELA
jgi:hypothetical protein